MDSRLRELERRWHAGEMTPELAMSYLTTLKRTGGKLTYSPRLKPGDSTTSTDRRARPRLTISGGNLSNIG